MSTPNDQKTPRISPERKAIYYVGLGLMVLGGALCAIGFVRFASGGPEMLMPGFLPSGMPDGFGMFLAGMLLLVLGGIVSRIGARGAAGSGLLLDPDKARDDLHPYTHMAGGMVKDAVDAFREDQPAAPQEVIKVRCPHCKALNDENDKFCGQCGKEL